MSNGKANSRLRVLSAPVEINPACVPLSEKELARFAVTDFDELLPKWQVAVALLKGMPLTADVQKVLAIVESSVTLMESEAA